MNSDIIHGKWTELKGKIQKQWGKLTEDEVEKSKGNAAELAGLLQQRYGYAKEDALKRVNELMDVDKDETGHH